MSDERRGDAKPEVSSHYLGEAGEEYTRQRLRNPAPSKYKMALPHFAPYLEPSQTVLDFGCGAGGLLALVEPRVAHADGLEVNPAAAELARERTGCRVFASLDELPPDQTYDLILSNHVLEHIRDVCSTLERLRPHLRPGGRFVTMLPINDYRDSYHRGWSHEDVDRHLQTWPPRLFANVLYESGYEVEECRVIYSRWAPSLEPFARLGLARLAAWAFARVFHRPQLLGVGIRPQ